MPALERISGTRIVATSSALDAANWPVSQLVLRLAADEVLLIGEIPAIEIDDPHAIVVAESGFVAQWLPIDQALDFLARSCEWALPATRPAFAQGAVAGLPVKLWLEDKQALIMTPAPYATDLEERMR